MSYSQQLTYHRIAQAIQFIQSKGKAQPSLAEIAASVHLSPFHFQRLFKEWVGTTPKKFLQYLTVEHAKSLLKDRQATLFDTTSEIGLSSPARLHDLFISIEGMTPAEFKHGGKLLTINYQFAESPFGTVLIASTEKGICQMSFIEEEASALMQLKTSFPYAEVRAQADEHQRKALSIFQLDWTDLPTIKLHLKATEFQLNVWKALLQIPLGRLSTYGTIATEIENPSASRAVGTAIGSNPVAFLIPCHRVVQSSGHIGGYMWNPIRKSTIIGWESAKVAMD